MTDSSLLSVFESISFGKDSIPALAVTVGLMVLLPVGLCIYWRLRHKRQTNGGFLIAGILGFLVSARVLELAVHYFCILSDNPVSRFISGSTLAYVIYGITMAGVFEECGRHIVLKFIMKKNRTRENAILYGIGHGGIEVLAVILPGIITCLAVAVLFTSTNTSAAMAALNITEETAAAALPSVQSTAAFNYGTMAVNVIERMFAMLVHIGLTVVVFYGVVNTKRGFLPLAILLHMLVDTFAALYQRGAVSIVICELWIAVWTVVIVVIAVRLYRKLASPAAETAV